MSSVWYCQNKTRDVGRCQNSSEDREGGEKKEEEEEQEEEIGSRRNESRARNRTRGGARAQQRRREGRISWRIYLNNVKGGFSGDPGVDGSLSQDLP